jgi:hypothetical protein
MPQTAEQLAATAGGDAEDVYHCLNHLAANGAALTTQGTSPATDTFALPLAGASA